MDKLIEVRKSKQFGKNQRSSVSAEVYGDFNKKGIFTARVIKKSSEQKERIIQKTIKSIIFNSLDEKELNTVVDAMEERKFNTGDEIIKQGDNGDVLYLIESGELDCFKEVL